MLLIIDCLKIFFMVAKGIKACVPVVNEWWERWKEREREERDREDRWRLYTVTSDRMTYFYFLQAQAITSHFSLARKYVNKIFLYLSSFSFSICLTYKNRDKSNLILSPYKLSLSQFRIQEFGIHIFGSLS